MSWVLAFDTATEGLAVALGKREGAEIELIASHDGPAPRAAMSRLLPTASDVLREGGRGIGGVDEVVVGRGPGSFTGVRIGVSTAKGLARGLGAPLFGVGTLDAVAWALREANGLVGVIGDAMRGEVYPALFRLRAGRPERLGPDRVASPEEAAAEWAALGEDLLLVGNGLAKHAGTFAAILGARATIAEEDTWLPSGRGLLDAYESARSADAVGSGDPGSVLPIYTRLSDAEESERPLPDAGAAPTPPSGVEGPGDAP
jgi:tRNA threonylcarbamoyl adenosine modification protein YeaZ